MKFLLTIFILIPVLANSQSAEEYYNRGNAKNNQKDYSGAISDYNKAIEINPNYAETYYYRGIAKINISQKNSGCLDLSKAGELGYEKAYEMINKYCK